MVLGRARIEGIRGCTKYTLIGIFEKYYTLLLSSLINLDSNSPLNQ